MTVIGGPRAERDGGEEDARDEADSPVFHGESCSGAPRRACRESASGRDRRASGQRGGATGAQLEDPAPAHGQSPRKSAADMVCSDGDTEELIAVTGNTTNSYARSMTIGVA